MTAQHCSLLFACLILIITFISKQEGFIAPINVPYLPFL